MKAYTRKLKSISRIIIITLLVNISFGTFAQTENKETTEQIQSNNSVKEVAYAIPFIIILGILYIMKNARRKMITLGAGQLPLMTTISLLTGTNKEPGEYWKLFKSKSKGNAISGDF